MSLLNTATGEPRANVSVSANVTISDSSGGVIYSGTQQATSNDFGVISLTVGNADTFTNADSGKLPFFITVSVDGVMIGRSQILNVPVAEYAKKVASSFSIEELVGTWVSTASDGTSTLHFNINGGFSKTETYQHGSHSRSGKYIIDGNSLYMITTSTDQEGGRKRLDHGIYIDGAIHIVEEYGTYTK